MVNHDRIIHAIYDGIDEVNQMLPEGERLDKSPETVILGESGTLDSQGLLNFTIAAERKIEEEFGIEISLTDENIFLQALSPLHTVGSLADYIASTMESKGV